MLSTDAPPINPDAPTAHRWLKDELSKRPYQERKPLLERIVDWLAQHLGGSSVGGTGIPWWVLAGLFLLIIIGLCVLAWRRYKPTRPASMPPQAPHAAVFEPGSHHTATTYRALAEEQLELDPTAALIAAYRAAVARAYELGLLHLTPATTVGDIDRDLAVARPGLRAQTQSAGTNFAAARYGSTEASRDQAEAVLRLDEAIAGSDPRMSGAPQ